jgi:hypothetical protein
MIRLMGLFILFKTLAPVIIVILFALTLNSALADLRGTLETPMNTINQRTEQLQNNFEAVKSNMENLSASVTAVTNRVNQLASLIPTIPSQLTIPAITVPSPPALPVPNVSLTPRTISYPSGISFNTTTILGVSLIPTGLNVTWSNLSVPTVNVTTSQQTITIPSIPSFNVTVPGLNTAANAIAALRQSFDPIRDAFNDVRALGSTLDAIGADFSAVASETAAILNGISETGGRWAQQVLTLTIALVIVLGVIFAVTILNNLRTGLHMLLTGRRP